MIYKALAIPDFSEGSHLKFGDIGDNYTNTHKLRYYIIAF